MFAWHAYEAPGIYPDFICHHLNVNLAITPRKQPPKHSSKDHYEAVKDEVTKLKQVGAIKEVFYLEWLVNTVVVKKKSGKWRVDFIDLNKACSKDPFPFPRINQLVDVTVGHPLMSFLDAFQGYHQMIPLVLDDHEKTTFVTPIGNYHYKAIPFGLKNIRLTYQKMMTKMFESQMGKNIEVYIYNMLVKSKIVSKYIEDLTNIFEILRGHKLRFNPPNALLG